MATCAFAARVLAPRRRRWRCNTFVLLLLVLTAVGVLRQSENGLPGGVVRAQLGVPSGNLCSALNNCNGHGRCHTASKTCICFEGYGSDTDITNYKSPDCSLRSSNMYKFCVSTCSSCGHWIEQMHTLLASCRCLSLRSILVWHSKRIKYSAPASRVLRCGLLRSRLGSMPMPRWLRRSCLPEMYVSRHT